MMKLAVLSAPLLLSWMADDVVVDGQSSKPWGYMFDEPGVLSPIQWKNSYPSCDDKRQSPINIRTSATTPQSKPFPLTFSGKCDNFTMIQEESVFKGISRKTNCKVNLAGKTYNFLQFHSHVPSEHTIDGKPMDAELHFVHQLNGGKDRLAIGMFVEITESPVYENYWLGQAWEDGEDVSDLGGESQNVTIRGSYSALLWGLAHEGAIFNYPGSLTTPPCDENVDWWVMQTPVQLTQETFDAFAADMKRLASVDKGHNNRPVQPLNGRKVAQYKSLKYPKGTK